MILVTGGTGLLGSHLLFELSKGNVPVRALKRKNSNLEFVKRIFSYYDPDYEKLFDKIEWVEGDVIDIASLEDAMLGVDDVYHLAAMVSFDDKDKGKMQKVNAEGTANMVNTALRYNIKKFCHVSSIATLNDQEFHQKVNEGVFWKSSSQNSYYAISKYNAECEVWRASEEGLPVIIVNPSVIIGPGNWKTDSSRMIAEAYKGLSFYTHGITGFVDVRDVVNVMLQLMKSNIANERFIVNSENKSFKEFFDIAQQYFGKRKSFISANKFLMEIGWRLEKIKSIIFSKPPLLTKQSARAALKRTNYSNEKIIARLQYQFIAIEKAVEHTSKLFLLDQNKINSTNQS